MGSPLGPVLPGIIMAELEKYMVPKLEDHSCFWKCYVDDTSTFLKSLRIFHRICASTIKLLLSENLIHVRNKKE